MTDIQDYPTVTVLETTDPIAQKTHICELCKKPIEKGIKHKKTVMMVDGKFESMRYHIYCYHGE